LGRYDLKTQSREKAEVIVIINTMPSFRFGDLTSDEYKDFISLLSVLSRKRARNKKRRTYYEAKNKVNDLGISIPPPLKDMNICIGWPAKAVDTLAGRSVFEGFVSADGDETELNAVLSDNAFTSRLYPQTVRDELMHSCAFVTVTKGEEGEPEVLISGHSAETATALWDNRKKRVSCGLVITKVVEKEATEYVMFTDAAAIRIGVLPNGRWTSTRAEHSMGRPLIEPLVYKPANDRPFGRARISRGVMSITDRAIRAIFRTEVASEFYAAPQRYVLGAEEDLFANGKWEAYIGNWLGIPKDEDGDLPTVGQFPAMSMDPYLNQMRSLAAEFAGETHIPVSYLGVIHDNPASAEAMYAASEELIIEAQSLNITNGEALKNIGLMALAILKNVPLSGLTPEQKGIQPKFANPAQTSVVSSSDAIVKQVSAIPWIAETRVALEALGYTEEQIVRMLSDKRKADGRRTLDEALAKQGVTHVEEI
jgi:hypothetical protein